MTLTGAMTGIERVFGTTKADEDNIAQRRKPRMYASINTDPSPATPYHIDFCMWLQSEEFGKNRIMNIVRAGGRWLGAKTAW